MSKADRYTELRREIAAVLDGETDRGAQMATIACLVARAFPHHLWTGFYVIDPQKPDELVVGPYQGTLGCLRIAVGKGVCGTAAATGKTQVVSNVHQFEGHIACDSRSVSEIVVPVRDPEGRLLGVFDIDGPDEAMFGEVDKHHLEALIAETFGA